MGHPEHELIFLGHQVAKAAGLADPARSLKQWRSTKEGHGSNFLTLKALIDETSIKAPEYVTSHGLTRAYRGTMAMLTEAEAYTMLLRSNAPKTEPFRRWVTEEVLPTIRKTGQYNAAESSDPIAVGIMDAGVAKTLTMAARSQRPYEDHYHDPAHSTRTTSPPRRSRHRHHPSY
ncbi:MULTISPECIES: BRO family protein [Pseudomonas]|uniref:BRO-N domain-containing protein n=1 Tax=Pseudomonas TaxID=286 RepID=UPI001305002A|nr:MULTISPECIES: BRO family protein [Pseudomonas]GLO17917.1 hypothetical protein PPUJ20188_13110 [Pseudomonas putida]HDS0995373.1 hypothetical protein [Pseudomonas putida]HDS1762659.1 hypothetical protein [Pseudomonas putida]